MLLTLALVVLVSSIVVFFSEEFIKAFKKIFAIKGVKLFLPLFAASWIIYNFSFWFLWAIFYTREILHDVLNFLIRIMPFQKGAESVALVFMLAFLSVVPTLFLDVWLRRKNFRGYQHPYALSSLIFILSVFLLIIL